VILDPDFLDHWRTRMVVDALGDECAPMCILRLWAHCQVRKSDRFAMPTAGLKAQCRFTGDAQKFEQALIEAGFIARDGGDVHVLGWAEQNAALLAAWDNGARGGRPKKPKVNPRVTNEKPTGNPTETHREPTANPDETDKSREDKKSPSLRSGEKRASAPHRPSDVDEQVWKDWVALRRRKRADVSLTTLEGAREQAQLAGMSLEAFLRVWCRRGSQGLEADWLKPHERASPVASLSDRRTQTIAGLTNPGANHGHPNGTLDVEARVVG
jgi:hypothetical protein